MTGVVTFEQLTWIIGIIVVAGGGVASFLFWVWRLVVGLKAGFAVELKERDEQLRERDSAAQLEKERAKLVEAELRKEINDYKVHAAERYATKEGVTQMGVRLEAAIERLTNIVHESVTAITSRVDRMLDSRQDPPKRGN